MERSGIIIVDKPKDISSAAVIGIIKRLFKAKKAGHTGTLDPFATGALICCINKATRLSEFFLKKDKKYRAVVCLGTATDTQDFTGKVISKTENINSSAETIKRAFKNFTGSIKQYPPVYSALKQDGVPLYKLARKGKPVQKPARDVFISNIEIIDINVPEITFEVSCSAGTYIRTLCCDIGDYLGCGAHLKELRRIKSGEFDIKQAVSLSDIKKLAESGKLEDLIISMSDSLPWMHKYTADQSLAEKVKYGRVITDKDIKPNYDDFIKIIDNTDNLLSIVKFNKNTYNYNYFSVFNQ